MGHFWVSINISVAGDKMWQIVCKISKPNHAAQLPKEVRMETNFQLPANKKIWKDLVSLEMRRENKDFIERKYLKGKRVKTPRAIDKADAFKCRWLTFHKISHTDNNYYNKFAIKSTVCWKEVKRTVNYSRSHLSSADAWRSGAEESYYNSSGVHKMNAKSFSHTGNIQRPGLLVYGAHSGCKGRNGEFCSSVVQCD